MPYRAGHAAATVPADRTIRAAPLDLAMRASGRGEGFAMADVASLQPRQVPLPQLEFRRPSAATPAPQPAAEPRAVAQPAAQAIDVDALSRDVMSRIEKRLRIERERHGRI